MQGSRTSLRRLLDRVTALLLIAGLPQWGVAAGDPFAGVRSVKDEQLNELRGGFETSQGLQFAFAIERAVVINGELLTSTRLVLDDLSPLLSGGVPNMQLIASVANHIVQNGSGNTVSSAPAQTSTPPASAAAMIPAAAPAPGAAPGNASTPAVPAVPSSAGSTPTVPTASIAPAPIAPASVTPRTAAVPGNTGVQSASAAAAPVPAAAAAVATPVAAVATPVAAVATPVAAVATPVAATSPVTASTVATLPVTAPTVATPAVTASTAATPVVAASAPAPGSALSTAATTSPPTPVSAPASASNATGTISPLFVQTNIGAGGQTIVIPSASAIVTAVQNTVNNQIIQTRTTIDAVLNSLSALRANLLTESIRQQALDAVRRP